MTIYIQKKELLLFTALGIGGSLTAAILLCLWGTTPEIFGDIIMGVSAQNNINKIAEETIFWLICFTGMVILSVYLIQERKQVHMF